MAVDEHDLGDFTGGEAVDKVVGEICSRVVGWFVGEFREVGLDGISGLAYGVCYLAADDVNVDVGRFVTLTFEDGDGLLIFLDYIGVEGSAEGAIGRECHNSDSRINVFGRNLVESDVLEGNG